jgi:hypothetical protein
MKQRSMHRLSSPIFSSLGTVRLTASATQNRHHWVRCRGSASNTVLATVLGVAAALMLVLGAALTWPYAYFSLLRVVVFGCAASLAWLLLEAEQTSWAVALGGVALLFNPFLPVYLTRAIWQVVDVVVAGVMITSMVVLHRSKKK